MFWMLRILLIIFAVVLLASPVVAQQPMFDDDRVFERQAEDLPPIPEAVQFVESATVPQGEPARPGDTIDSVQVSGNRRVEADSVLAQVRSREGAAIDLDTVSQDIRRVFGLGFFDDIRVDATRSAEDGRVYLTFIVSEKPAIAEVRYEGNRELKTSDIEEVIDLRRNQILNVSDVANNAEKIRELYADKGFFLAEVSYRIVPRPNRPDMADVIFDIREYAKVQVRRITFLGNEAIGDDELKNIIATREGDWGSFLTSFGSFKEEAFEIDLQRIVAYYYDKGFVQVRVARPQVRLSRDKRYLFITIRITEGPAFDVGTVDLQGDFIADKSELEELVRLTPGERFSYGKMRLDAERLQALYMDAGYAYVNINPLTRAHDDTRKVDVVFDIQKGSQVYFGRIEVVGNSRTRDKVIRRELAILEGDLYSNTALELSRTRIQRLGYFEKVDITTQRAERSDRINARVELSERPTGTFQVGAGFSSLESFILNAQISQNNLFGRGQSLAFQAQASSLRTLFNVQFTEPWLFDSRWQLSFDLYNFDFVFPDFSRRSRGGNLTLGYPITDELVLSLTYKLEDVELRPGGRTGRSTRRVGNLFRGGLTSSVRAAAIWDGRDNRLFPTKGQFHNARVELAHDKLTFSQNEFVKYDFETRWYFPLVWQFVLRLQGEVGYVQSISSYKPVPLFERYFAGGPTTVRGFERFTLGPARQVSTTQDPGTFLSDFQIGGNKRLILTAEIEFPILTAVGIKGVVFADAGNAFDDGVPLSLKLDLFSDDINRYEDVLRTSVGFGFRWFSPIGPLRFEWGIPLSRQRDEKPLVFDFSITQSF